MFFSYLLLTLFPTLDDGLEVHSFLQCGMGLIRTEVWPAVWHFTVASLLLCSLTIPDWQNLASIGLGLLFLLKRKIFGELGSLSQIWNSYLRVTVIFHYVWVGFIIFLELSFLFLNKKFWCEFPSLLAKVRDNGGKTSILLFWNNFFFSYKYHVRKSALHDGYLFLINNKILHTENVAICFIKCKSLGQYPWYLRKNLKGFMLKSQGYQYCNTQK